MMQLVSVQLEDDLTGGPADETVTIGVDGKDYEIDLNARHAAELRRRLAPFVDRARLARPRRPGLRARTAASRQQSRQVRLWASQQGYAVSGRGRLPGHVIHDYQVAHSADVASGRGAQPASASRTPAPQSAQSAGAGSQKSAASRRRGSGRKRRSLSMAATDSAQRLTTTAGAA